MSAIKQMMGQSAQVTDGGGNVEDLYKIQLHTGNSSPQTVTTGLNLADDGGIVWIKNRTSTGSNFIFGSDRTINNQALLTNNTTGYYGTSYSITHTTTGFDISTTSSGDVNENNKQYVSWNFKKASKFFDIQTWTGNGTAGRTISHDLGSNPGMVWVKRTDSTSNWEVFHRSLTSGYKLVLNSTGAESSGADITATSSTSITLSDSFTVNGNNATYVGYFFAHNDGDGIFGPTGDQDIIKCGVYTGNGSHTDGPEVDLGFEPQWLMTKGITSGNAYDWRVHDFMRGMEPNGVSPSNIGAKLEPNTFDNEDTLECRYAPTATGFRVMSDAGVVNANTAKYIYVAIRRGPMAIPTSSSEVFHIDTSTSDSSGFTHDATFRGDLVWYLRRDDGNNNIAARNLHKRDVFTTTTDAERDVSSYLLWDVPTGYKRNALLGNASTVDYLWQRAPHFCDVVLYEPSGGGFAQNIPHTLGVVPEMMWVKNRTDSGLDWAVYHKDAARGQTDLNFFDGGDKYLELNTGDAVADTISRWNDRNPTDTHFFIRGGSGHSNNTLKNDAQTGYIAILFATLAGVSKVGSYTGNGSNQNIECGFSNGAKFVMIKSLQSGNWHIFDTTRGLVAGNDTHLRGNLTDAEVSTADSIDPYSGGFNVVQNATTDLNKGPNDEIYIFYAIAA